MTQPPTTIKRTPNRRSSVRYSATWRSSRTQLRRQHPQFPVADFGRAFQAVAVSLLPLGNAGFLLFFASDTCWRRSVQAALTWVGVKWRAGTPQLALVEL